MQALVYRGARDVVLEERPDPQPGPGEVRVRVAASGLCGSDLHVIASGQSSVPPPLVLGHEFGGTLDDGRFVVVNPMLACGQCALCARGSTHICPQRRVLGFRQPGGFAHWVVVPARNVVPADGLSPEQAALVEPLANGVHAWARAGCPMGEVAVIGAGSVGMSLLHVLRARGVAAVDVVDPVPARRAWAAAAGARRVGARLEGLYDAVFDAAGTESTRRDAVAATRAGGTVALVGLHDDTLALSAAALVVGDRTLAGCFAYTEREFVDATALVRSLDAPWAQSVPFTQAAQAVREILAGTAPAGRIKTLFRFDA